MFILRQKAYSPRPPFERNLILGNSYILELRVDESEQFKMLAEKSIDSENLYGFIVYNDGGDFYPLYLHNSYYIMTSDGKTFANISYK